MKNISPEKMARALEVYNKMIEAFVAKDVPFDRFDDDLVIKSQYKGQDFPIDFIFSVDPQKECVTFLSDSFAEFPDDKLKDAAFATAVANFGMAFGHFDLNLSEGNVYYVMSTSYIDSTLGEQFFFFMLATALSTADRYNDRFFMLAKGMIDLQKFIELEGSD